MHGCFTSNMIILTVVIVIDDFGQRVWRSFSRCSGIQTRSNSSNEGCSEAKISKGARSKCIDILAFFTQSFCIWACLYFFELGCVWDKSVRYIGFPLIWRVLIESYLGTYVQICIESYLGTYFQICIGLGYLNQNEDLEQHRWKFWNIDLTFCIMTIYDNFNDSLFM